MASNLRARKDDDPDPKLERVSDLGVGRQVVDIGRPAINETAQSASSCLARRRFDRRPKNLGQATLVCGI